MSPLIPPPPPQIPSAPPVAPVVVDEDPDKTAKTEALKAELMAALSQQAEPVRRTARGKASKVVAPFKTVVEVPSDIYPKWPFPACKHGWHEGTRAHDLTGKAVQVCKREYTTPPGYGPKVQTYHCGCSCHTDLDMMFEMSGEPRRWVDNPEYRKPVNDFWIPSPEERAAAMLEQKSPTAEIVTYDDGVSAPEVRVEFDISPDAQRRPKGLLDQLAQQACNGWLQLGEGRHIMPCSVKYISARCADLAGDEIEDRPSEGALANVLKRWAAIGAAIIGEKPVQFIDWTEEGRTTPLHVLREKHKRNSKSAAAATARFVPSAKRAR